MFEHVDEGCQCEGKVCSKCNTVKCLVAYHTDKRSSDDRVITCKDCVNARRRQQRQDNIETSRAYHREYKRLHAEELKAKRNLWYQQNAEQRAKKSVYYRKHADQITDLRKVYQKAHEDEIKEYRDKRYKEKAEDFREEKRIYYQENVEVIKLRRKELRTLHPERFISADKAQTAKKRARKLQAEGSFSADEWLELKREYNYSCLCCGRREPDICLTVDRVIPLVKGGTNRIDNIQPLCVSCNSKKHSKSIDYRGDKK